MNFRLLIIHKEKQMNWPGIVLNQIFLFVALFHAPRKVKCSARTQFGFADSALDGYNHLPQCFFACNVFASEKLHYLLYAVQCWARPIQKKTWKLGYITFKMMGDLRVLFLFYMFAGIHLPWLFLWRILFPLVKLFCN